MMIPARWIWGVVALAMLVCAAPALAETKSWTLRADEEMRERLVQIPVAFDETYEAGRLAVMEAGKRVACQVEVIKGTAAQVVEGRIWVCVTAKAGETRKFEVTTGAEAQKFEPRVKVSREGEEWILDNGLLAVKVPAAVGTLAGPIGGVKVGGKWIGASHWQSSTVFNSLQARVTGDGVLFGQVELLYIFNDPTYGGRIPFASVTVRMPPGRRYVVVEESMAMEEGDRWVMDLRKGWEAKRQDLTASDGRNVLGVQPLRPGEWEDAGDAKIGVSEKALELIFPTKRGTRHWMLFAGTKGVEKEAE